MQENITFEEWLNLPLAEIAKIVGPKNLSVCIAIDGTKRHYLVHNPELNGRITNQLDFNAYTGESYARLFKLFFDAGVTTLMVPLLNDDNLTVRGEKYITYAIDWIEQATAQTPFPQVYAEYGVQAQLYGDYSYNPAASFMRARLEQINDDLQNLTASARTNRKILFGVYAGSITAEFIARSCEFERKLGRVPTEQELKQAWFPDGPEKINIFICMGWLVYGGLVPAIFGHQSVDVYNLPNLGLDLSEAVLRRILYDYIFLRHAAPYDMTEYSPEDITTLREYYAQHNDCLVGTGELIGPKIWHPHHSH